MLILAHRGASADRPENTLPAFEEARVQGADGIELDVMRCGSGELVVCHDERLERLAGVPWAVGQTPWWKLSRVRVFGQARIPLLEEVLRLVPSHWWVNVELKNDRLDDGGLAEATGHLLTRMNRVDQVVVSSFNPFCLFRLARSHPNLRRGYLWEPEQFPLLHAELMAPVVANYSIHPAASACTPARVSRWHERGWQVITWTVDDPQQASQLKAMGVDALITNRPRQLREAMG